jgi:sarcosine oxidase subunit alpha
LPEVTLLTRACVFGYYDHNLLAIAERAADHLREPAPFRPRQRLWQVRARQVVLATGALERSLVFADNDRPGVMLAAAARSYVNRFAVRPGRRAVVFTNNDSAYAAAADLAAGGLELAAVVDLREPLDGAAAAAARGLPSECLPGHAVVAVHGTKRVEAVEVAPLRADGSPAGGRRIACDLLCVSGGWNPTVHLHAQARGRPRYDERLAAFVPGPPFQNERSAGAANGSFGLAAGLREGFEAGAAAARAAGFDKAAAPPVPAGPDDGELRVKAVWSIPPPRGRRRKRFVDLQNDVTAEDVALAAREGYGTVEHLKRYTTLGMGTDQGRTGNLPGLAILAGILGQDIASLGTTTFQPPYTPVTIGTIAGPEVRARYAPIRRTAMHAWHQTAGAPFIAAGLWLRPQYYPRAGETASQAIRREVLAVRDNVGLIDVSTLGKIDIRGRDAAAFLDRVYINNMSGLAVGRCRYGVMLREDGMVFDDGTTSRLGEQRYLMTTTTVKAGPVMQHLEYLLQTVWPELEVHIVSVTEEWSAMAVAGPDSRKLLTRLVDDVDVSDAALPHMGVREGNIRGVPARLFRLSFSGELAYEIYVPADYGLAVWEVVLEAGADLGVTPYGTEAMGILRMEKGHVVGGEINGRTTADDLGFGRMLSRRKDFIGCRSLRRPGLEDPNRKQLVGLVPADDKTPIPRGAQLVADPRRPAPNPMEGEVTSQCVSPTLGKPIGLALLVRGRSRHGETLHACSPLTGETVAVTVTHPVFVDPEGERLRV